MRRVHSPEQSQIFPGMIAEASGGTLFPRRDRRDAAGLADALPAGAAGAGIRPLGSTKTIAANFRLVAATNRNVAAASATAPFGRIFITGSTLSTLEIPALRDRREDIPALVSRS
jgi:transcriptional regulator of acetoin/glycerol metabolism